MPIEFYCSACEAYLRAPESKAGLSTSCPHCTSRIWIPVESEVFESVEDEVSEFADSSLPLKAERAVGTTVEQSFIEPEEVDISSILADTWQIFVENWKASLAVTAVDTVLTIAAVFVLMMVGGIAAAMVANQPVTAFLAFFAIVGLGLGVAMSMFAVGHIRFYLDLCRGKNPVIKKSVDFQGPVGRMLFGGMIYWGLFIFIFPPIFLWPYGRVVMDQNRSAVGSVAGALRLSIRHSGVCFVLFLVKFGAISASTLIPVVGQILVTPYLAILNTVAYLHFIGELE